MIHAPLARIAGVLLASLATFPSLGATLERGPIVVEYTQGNESLALETMEELHTGLTRYGLRLPAGEAPVHVTICATIEEFEALSGGVPAMRVLGFARSEEGIIVLKAPALLGPDSSYAAVVRHELLHVLLARNADPDNLPRWLNEGIAMILSRENRWSSTFTMARMYTGGRIIPYADLPHVFNAPGNETVFGEAYVQSLSMTRYLQSELGQERFWVVVGDLRSSTFEEALTRGIGVSPEAFFETWRDSLWRTALIASLITGISVFQIGALLLVLAYLRKRMRNRKLMRAWNEDEDSGWTD